MSFYILSDGVSFLVVDGTNQLTQALSTNASSEP
jgi:hypothetical protein